MPWCCIPQKPAENVYELYDRLKASDSKSLLKKYLTQECFDKLKKKKTSYGGTLALCIKSGCINTDSSVGIYACDPDAYNTYSILFDPIIKEYHKVTTIEHPICHFGEEKDLDFGDLDPNYDYIYSTRVRVGRNLEPYPFPPLISPEARLEIEKKVENAVMSFMGEFQGEYYPLTGMSRFRKNILTDHHFLFNDNNRFLEASGAYKHWPSGRGIFHNTKKTFLTWVNEEDHLRVISMQQGGDLKEVYLRLIMALDAFQLNGMKFAWKAGLGYLTFCPTNLGTAMRASVHIRIPYLSQSPDFHHFINKLNMDVRGIDGEHTESRDGVFDISNKRRLGLTELELLNEFKDGVLKVIEEEKKLSQE